MTQYLISFEKGAMDHIPEEDFPDVGKAAHAVVQEAKDAGVFLFAGGLSYDDGDVEHAVVATDGIVTDGPYPESKELIGGVMIVDDPPGRRPSSGPQRTRSPAAANKTSASSCPATERTLPALHLDQDRRRNVRSAAGVRGAVRAPQ
jgi:hypothetical protein